MINIIPYPQKIDEKYGEFILSNFTTIYAEPEFNVERDMFIDAVQDVCKFRLNVLVSNRADICFLFDRKQPEEGYKISCDSDHLHIFASSNTGAFYAVESLKQLFCMGIADNPTALTMHAMECEDYPRFDWRGIMLDESRHFFGKDEVKRILDMMAVFKMNKFHWHLTDNNGWRIEIKKYPKLTEIGSVRKGTQYLAWGKPNIINWVSYGGYYTQEDIREIVEYASGLHIEVIPEIDMPQHLVGAIAAYPWLSCTGDQIEVNVRHWDNKYAIACAGSEKTYEFIYDIIDEICDLFPSKYFHIGGDEANKKSWETCPRCQQTIKDNNLSGEEGLQGYFNNKVAVYLKRKGKTMIGWNEILKADNLEKSVIAEYWTPQRDKNVETNVQNGRKVIIAKHQHFYFDMPYAMRRLENTYQFHLNDYNIPEESVLGVEGTLWSEWIADAERLEYQTFPRMQAISEVAWTNEKKKNYHEFRKRLSKTLVALTKLGYNYASEHFVDKKGLSALTYPIKFIRSDAHYEFKKAMKYKRRFGK